MKKKLSLLERAKSLPVRKNRDNKISMEEIELALAWLQDEITVKNAADVLGVSPPSGMNRMALALREAYQQGFFKIK